MNIKEKLAIIKEDIAETCRKININPREIAILAATKNKDLGQIQETIEAGIKIIGENRVQEAEKKYLELCKIKLKQKIQLHFIGFLQRNKINKAVRIFDCIQSVDKYEIAEKIDREAKKLQKKQSIFIQVNISKNAQKSGCNPRECANLIKHIKNKCRNINVEGLMTITKHTTNPEESRLYFKEMKKLFSRISRKYGLEHLSMGMSQDYKVAIQEGSTMIRLGKLLFQ